VVGKVQTFSQATHIRGAQYLNPQQRVQQKKFRRKSIQKYTFEIFMSMRSVK